MKDDPYFRMSIVFAPLSAPLGVKPCNPLAHQTRKVLGLRGGIPPRVFNLVDRHAQQSDGRRVATVAARKLARRFDCKKEGGTGGVITATNNERVCILFGEKPERVLNGLDAQASPVAHLFTGEVNATAAVTGGGRAIARLLRHIQSKRRRIFAGADRRPSWRAPVVQGSAFVDGAILVRGGP